MTVFRWVRGIRYDPDHIDSYHEASLMSPLIQVGVGLVPIVCPFCDYRQNEEEMLYLHTEQWDRDAHKWVAAWQLEGGCLRCGAEYEIGFDAPDEMPEMPQAEDRGAGDG